MPRSPRRPLSGDLSRHLEGPQPTSFDSASPELSHELGRAARLVRVLHEELASILRDELDDPRLNSVTLTAVTLSPDFAHLRAGFVPDEGHGATEVLRALEAATPLLRGRLAASVELKRVPSLRFTHDRDADGARAALRLLGPDNSEE